MLVTGMSLETFRECTARVSALKYGGNVIVAREYTVHSGNRFAARLTVADPAGAGARRSASGRRGPWACWHAYRDVLMDVFRVNPAARVRSGRFWVVDYNGVDRFRALYPPTADVNIGSKVLAVTMPECCACGGNVPRTAAEYRRAFEAAFAGYFSRDRITPRAAVADPEPASLCWICGKPGSPGLSPDRRSCATCDVAWTVPAG